MKNSVVYLLTICSLVVSSCKSDETKPSPTTIIRKAPKTLSYTLNNTKEWILSNQLDSIQREILLSVNRIDESHLKSLDSLIVPSDLNGDLSFYLPFPQEVAFLNKVTKLIYFSYPSQTFAAYENGILVKTGATNMGRKKDRTPTGLFFTNWKAESTNSTFNDEWELKWNFNIENKLGIGFHQYDLPGFPVSHSCLRLLEKDAKFLYQWADEWILEDNQTVLYKGTPVLIFGSYNFDLPKPWLQLVDNPEALTISVQQLEDITTPFLAQIISEQQKK